MHISIETNQEAFPRQLRSSMRDKASKALERFSHRIQTAKLTIKDINSEKGGIDKVCTVQMQLVQGGELVVTKRGFNNAQALFRALRGIRHLVARRAARDRQLRYPSYKRSWA